MNKYEVSKDYKPCLAMYEMNVFDPLARPIPRSQMCGARRSVFFMEFFVSLFGKVKIRKPIEELSFCGAHATDFCHAQRALMEKYRYYYNLANHPFCKMLKNGDFTKKTGEK